VVKLTLTFNHFPNFYHRCPRILRVGREITKQQSGSQLRGFTPSVG